MMSASTRSIVVIAVFSVGLHSRPADACTCPAIAGPVSPRDAATGVPTNAVLFFDTHLQSVDAITLTASDTSQVTLMLEPSGGMLIARPATTLAPNATYAVSTTVAGQVLTTTFTTGTGPDTAAPSFPGVTSLGPEFMQFTTATGPTGQGCFACDTHYAADDRLSRIHFTFPDPPPDTVMLGVEISMQGDSSPLAQFGLAPAAFADRLIGSSGCGPSSPELHDGVTYCARVTAYDAAGNAAGSSAEACATPMACAAQLDATCEPLEACLPVDSNPGGGSDQTMAPQTGGCSSSPGAALFLVLFAFAPVLRRTRREA